MGETIIMHHYEVSLQPTAGQAMALKRLADIQQRLTWEAEQDWGLAELTGTVPLDPEFTWAAAAGLPQALIREICAQARTKAQHGQVSLFATRPPYQLALTGPGLLQPLSPGLVTVVGVPGAIAAGTGDPAQLPAWAQEVLGREYQSPGPQELRSQVPALQEATRVDWADVREERHGWVLEVSFNWSQYAPFELSWVALQQRPNNPLLRLLIERR